jgi:type I restriction enzyme M protein
LAAVGNFFLVPPEAWLFPTHGDVAEAKRRAEEYRHQKGYYDGAEFVIEEFVRQWVLAQLVDACCTAWNALTAEAGRIKSIASRQWLTTGQNL